MDSKMNPNFNDSTSLKDIKIYNINDVNVTPEFIYVNKLKKVFVNGDWIAVCNNPYKLCNLLKQQRRDRIIDPYSTIYYDVMVSEIYIWVDVGRITRPLLIVYNNIDNPEYFDEKYSDKLNNFQQKTLMTKEILNKLNNIQEFDPINNNKFNINNLHQMKIIDYISPEEHENCMVSVNIETLNANKNNILSIFTHCDIEQSIAGIPCLTSPYANHNQGPRIIYQTNQVKQACGWFAGNYPDRIDKEGFLQYYCEDPLTRTIANNYISPIGANAIVAIQCYSGYNQEDSMIGNQSAFDRGLFNGSHFTYEQSDLDKGEVFGTAPINETMDFKAYANYDKIQSGFVPNNTIINKNDVIISKYGQIPKSQAENEFKYMDKSLIYKGNESVSVYNSLLSKNSDDITIAKIALRSERSVDIGDKFSSRSGQKGVVGITLKQCDMPFTENGIIPDLIINPHAIPSRMTIGQLIETLENKRNAMEGIITDATLFNKPDINQIGDDLTKLGYNRYGNERLFDGRTGEWIDVVIFMGPTYYQRLQKFTVDAIYSVRKPVIDAITRQPLSGKSSGGGLKVGEMEKDVFNANGAMRYLNEKFYQHSDAFDVYICKTCGKYAIYNEEKNIAKCKTISCNGLEEIVKVHSSWSTKLFMQELNAMNIGVKFGLDELVFTE
jgi:DNA-directed RNA polymerase beta subunit